jgi:tetratricopeptide (TPR) repeat protein
MILHLVETAELAEKNGDYENALQIWRQLCSETNRAIYFCRWGNAAQRLTRWDEAEKAFEHALSVDSKFSSAMEGLGALFSHRADGNRRRNIERARDWYLSALSIHRYARTLNLLGAAYMELGQRSDAKAAFLEAIDIDNSFSEPYFNLAFLEKQQNPLKAKSLLEQCIELSFDELRPHRELGILLQKEGSVQAAEEEFRRCLEIAPEDYWSRLYLADNLAVQGHDIEAEQQYRIAMSVCEDTEAGIRFFANFLDSISRSEEAAVLRSRIPKKPE